MKKLTKTDRGFVQHHTAGVWKSLAKELSSFWFQSPVWLPILCCPFNNGLDFQCTNPFTFLCVLGAQYSIRCWADVTPAWRSYESVGKTDGQSGSVQLCKWGIIVMDHRACKNAEKGTRNFLRVSGTVPETLEEEEFIWRRIEVCFKEEK